MSWPDIIRLIASILACLGAGAVGALFTMRAIPAWYTDLRKPSFTPPNAVFGPVWTTLYLLMGAAVFLVWREGLLQPDVVAGFAVFWFQLALNVLWSVVFFWRRSLFGGVIVILFLWAAIVAAIVLFFRVSALAGGLLVPYIIWVSIAANLNLQIWRLNR